MRSVQTIDWSNWLRTIQSNPSQITEKLDEAFRLEKLNDEAEEQALKHALQSHEEQVLFLEDRNQADEGDGMVAYRLGNEWKIRSLSPDVSRDVLSKFLHYTMNAVECIDATIGESDFGDYYSLRPLVYGGHYWLDTVCRQEFNRYQDLKESGVLSVMVVPWQEDRSLFELVESLRRGDRVGYFEDLLGIALPFTDHSQMEAVDERLQSTFEISQTYRWQVERDFENLHELSVKVKELL